jgi:hypothetical protein
MNWAAMNKYSDKFYVSGVIKPYDDFGPALSRSITEACKRTEADQILVTLEGDIVAHSTRNAKGHIRTVQLR